MEEESVTFLSLREKERERKRGQKEELAGFISIEWERDIEGQKVSQERCEAYPDAMRNLGQNTLHKNYVCTYVRMYVFIYAYM